MKKSILLLFALIPLLVFTACKADNRTVLSFAAWGGLEEQAIIKEALGIFESENPDARVQIIQLPQSGDYLVGILTRASTGNAPDIIFCEVNVIDKFMERNILLDLNPFFEAEGETFSVDDYFPEIINRFVVDGRVYALPRDIAPYACVYYNKDIFDIHGTMYPTDDWNINDMIRIATGLQTRFAANEYAFYSWPWQNSVFMEGASLVDDDIRPTKSMINSPEAKRGLQTLIDLMYKHNVMPMPGNMSAGGGDLFMTSKIAMYNSGIWESPQFRKITMFDWDVAMFPKGSRNTRGFESGGSAYGIYSKTKSQELAWKLLKHVSGSNTQTRLAELGLAQPAMVKLAQSDVWAGSDSKPLNKGMLNEAIQYIRYNPFDSRWPEIASKFVGPTIDRIMRKEVSVEEGTERIARDVNEALVTMPKGDVN